MVAGPTKALMAAVIILAAVFYFWHLGRPDVVTDESSIAARAIGLVDFDFGVEQPTPWQWVDAVPWWMRLSFHDHPPLVFWLQHWSIGIFGGTPFAIRLPSVIAGLASVLLVYLMSSRLYSPAVGFGAAALFAFTVNHVWVSRVGLQESIAIALMLASAHMFLRGLENPKWFKASAAFLGLAFLAKYYALILIPMFATAILWRKLRAGHASIGRGAMAGLVLPALYFLLIASPVIIYNVQLYRNFGHFDFQFSLLAGQDVEAWQARPGQETLGSYAERVRTYIPRLIDANSPYFLILAASGAALIAFEFIRRRGFRHAPLVISFTWLFPFLIFIGPAHRFLSLLTPWLAIAAGYAMTRLVPHRRAAAVVLAAIVIVEASYAYSSVIALDPFGSRPWTHSYLRRQAHSWGFNELNRHLDDELEGEMPDPAISFEFPFARKILERAIAEGREKGLTPSPTAIIFNDNINLSSQLWIFLRRVIYRGWPVVSAEQFRRGGADDFLRKSGVKRIYFINPTEHALQDRTLPPTPDGDMMEAELKKLGAIPVEIKNRHGEVAFRAYRFEF